MLVIFTGPSFERAFTPNRPLFWPENVTNSVEGSDSDILPSSNFCNMSSSSPL
tara:strand:+ start:754 stop:912 length:159 start_codon:yes stop_codon:yes gene_type:complete